VNRAQAWLRKGDHDRAIVDFDLAFRLDPQSDAVNNADFHGSRAWAYHLSGRDDEALSSAEKAIELAPDDAAARKTRGHIYLVLGHVGKAIEDFGKAIELDAEMVSAYMGRGLAYERKGDRDRALADFKIAVALPASTQEAKTAQAKAQERLASLSPTAPTRRIALVIGNAAYTHASRLNNPAADAKAIAAALRRIGFGDVTDRYDLGYSELRAALKAFGDKAGSADWAVVYFAGHGIQVGQASYLIPTDARLARAAHVEDEAVALSYVLSKVEEARKLRLVILDACRENPFLARMEQSAGTRTLGRGLGRIEPERGILVAYAARDGQLALDGDERHSPFAKALLEHIEEPGLEIGLLFRKVRDRVLKLTGSAQEPFVYGSLPSDGLYFKAAAK
jgi:tetratricopeptide (TPR) repeat protein